MEKQYRFFPFQNTTFTKFSKLRGELRKFTVLILRNLKPAELREFITDMSYISPYKISIQNSIEIQDPEELKQLSRLIIKMKRLRTINVSSSGSSEISSLFIAIIQKLTKLSRICFDFSRTSLSKESFQKLFSSLSKKNLTSDIKGVFYMPQCNSTALLEEINEFLVNKKHLKRFSLFLKRLDNEHLERVNPMLGSIGKLKSLQNLELDLDECSLDNFSLKILMRSLEYLDKLNFLTMRLILNEDSITQSDLLSEKVYRFNNMRELKLKLKCLDNSSHLVSFIKPLRYLTELSLDFNASNINDIQLFEISSYMNDFNTLKKLSLDMSNCNNLTERGIRGVFSSIGHSHELERLSIVLFQFYNPEIFGECNMLTLKNSLTCLLNLKAFKLLMGRTCVRDSCYRIIGGCIKELTKLTYLELGYENSLNCSENSFRIFIDSLGKLENLEELKLYYQCCELGDNALLALANCVVKKTKLKKFEAKFPFHANFSPFGISNFRYKLIAIKSLDLKIIESPRAPVKTHQNHDLIMIILITILFNLLLYYLIF